LGSQNDATACHARRRRQRAVGAHWARGLPVTFTSALLEQVRHVTAPPAYGVFISYRRSDAGPYARLLQVQLSQHLHGTTVFMDMDSIDAGTDFAGAIESAVGSCRVLIALIGRRWLTVTDEGGRRRLDDPDDYVRFEIRTALERRSRVIPVLVDGAMMPQRQKLPDDLARLARLNALPMSYDRYEYDESRLINLIQKLLAAESTDATQ
jgi:hypothetical protein